MRAMIVYNTQEEPRLLIELESNRERELFKDVPDLQCIRTGEENDILADLAYVLRRRDDEGLIQNLPPGGIFFSDHLHVMTNDGSCSRCRQVIVENESPFLLWLAGGENMYSYCQRCAHDPTSDRCRACGCTEHRGCEEICHWQAPGLCSNCKPEEVPNARTIRHTRPSTDETVPG